MSTWRDIWRYGVIANRFYAENEEKGEAAFQILKEVYDKTNTQYRKDGMIRYIMAEAYELKYHQTNNYEYRDMALANYEEAAKLFPVDHWKKVAKGSYDRVNKNIALEDFFCIKEEKLSVKVNGKYKSFYVHTTDFDRFLWYGFEKVYRFVHLNDFARYVCLSALSRGSSEWPLSLVDFRTVLELEIKQCFPGIIDEEFYSEKNRYSLYKIIEKLYELKKINFGECQAFHNIRLAGNIAAHNLYADESYKKLNVAKFIEILGFFDVYRANNTVQPKEKIEYPLCQLTLEEYKEKLYEENELLESKL